MSSTGPPRWIMVLGLGVVVAAGALWLAARSDPGTSGDTRKASLRPLPAFSLRGFDGQTVTAEALAGRPAVINFFSSTCVFCIHEMPAFERVHARMGDRVSFLGVALRDSEPAARRLVHQTGVTYTLAFDDSGSFYQALRAFGMPVTAFILTDGSVASIHSGPLDDDQLQERIDELLDVAR